MVWFQCEDCGENFKKPKLSTHFNRCSAYKLSCIDCGIVFDQQSVQAHSSCISEAEKYGPKGLNKGVAGPVSKAPNGTAQIWSDVDFSRGLSTSPPWSCSLCNAQATSQQTLDLHGQGKKHQSRAKAAAAKERSKTQGGEAGAPGSLNIDASKDDPKEVDIKEDQVTAAALDPSSLSAEKKRKKMWIGEGGDLASAPSGKLERKLKRVTLKTDECLPESGKEYHDKKRKVAEEHQGATLGENGQSVSGKKSRKKGKVAPGEVNGDGDLREPNGEQVKKEKMGSLKDSLSSPLGNGFLSDDKAQTLGDESTKDVDCRTATELDSQVVNGKIITDKKTEKSKDLPDPEWHSETPAKIQMEDDVCKLRKKVKKKTEHKELNVHEISFREWLGEDDATRSETPTHPLNTSRGKDSLKPVESVETIKQSRKSKGLSTLDGIAKVVKWKKIIGEVLGKSLNGKLKKTDLKRAVLPLALKAMESASITVDRKALRAELLRQVTSSSKFVVDRRHVMKAPNL